MKHQNDDLGDRCVRAPGSRRSNCEEEVYLIKWL